MDSAREGLCNAGTLARLINHQIMAQCMGLGLASTTLKGGYDAIMLNRERKRADDAETRATEERRRVDALFKELRQERREERQRNDATQQALLETMAQINATLVQLLERQQNGRPSEEN